MGVLEAILICVDNSEWMRNGDYHPTRFDAQLETVNYLASAKTQSNPETTVGFLSMAGKRIEVHMTPTRNLGAIMTVLQKEVRIGGKANFLGALKTAQLALKNRQNKNQRQRVIMFVGSPVEEETKELVKLGKIFKKNSIAVDIINFGAENTTGNTTGNATGNDNPEKLEAFIQSVNTSDNSHLVNIPPGPHVFSDLVLTSPIMMENGVGASMALAGSTPALASAANQSVDPNVDPELAMVLKMSMEEAKQREKKATDAKGPSTSISASTSASISSTSSTSSSTSASTSSSTSSSTSASISAPTSISTSASTSISTSVASASNSSSSVKSTASKSTMSDSSEPRSGVMEDDDDAELAAAIAMSMVSAENTSQSSQSSQVQTTSTTASAISSSFSSSLAPMETESEESADEKELKKTLKDKDFLKDILGTVQDGDLQIDDLLDKLTSEEDDVKDDRNKTKDPDKDKK